jgi:hypothetical protein
LFRQGDAEGAIAGYSAALALGLHVVSLGEDLTATVPHVLIVESFISIPVWTR